MLLSNGCTVLLKFHIPLRWESSVVLFAKADLVALLFEIFSF